MKAGVKSRPVVAIQLAETVFDVPLQMNDIRAGAEPSAPLLPPDVHGLVEGCVQILLHRHAVDKALPGVLAMGLFPTRVVWDQLADAQAAVDFGHCSLLFPEQQRGSTLRPGNHLGFVEVPHHASV